MSYILPVASSFRKLIGICPLSHSAIIPSGVVRMRTETLPFTPKRFSTLSTTFGAIWADCTIAFLAFYGVRKRSRNGAPRSLLPYQSFYAYPDAHL